MVQPKFPKPISRVRNSPHAETDELDTCQAWVGSRSVFALGRMQKMLAVLDEAFRKKPCPRFRFFAQAWAWIWLITPRDFKNTNRVASTVKS